MNLVIAGGAAREAPGHAEVLRTLAEDLGLEKRVRIEAGFPDGGLPSIMAGVDVVAQASVLPDSLPTTVIEAMAGARPVVASAIGGCPELAGSRRHRSPLRARPCGRADRLPRTLRANPAKAERLGEAARREATSRFAVDTFADLFCRRLEDVVRKDSRAR